MRPLTKFVSIAHVHRWTLQDVKDFIFYVERLQYEETHCKKIDELNITQMCLLSLSKEKLDCWVKLQWINPALADILENASMDLKGNTIARKWQSLKSFAACLPHFSI